MHRWLLVCFILAAVSVAGATEPPVRVLFLGDSGPHQPAERFAQLQPVLEFTADCEPETAGVYVDHPVMTQPPAGLKALHELHCIGCAGALRHALQLYEREQHGLHGQVYAQP